MKITKLNLNRFAALTILPLLTVLALQSPLKATADQSTAPGQNKPKKEHLAGNPRHHVLCLAMNGQGACLTCEGEPGESYCIEATTDLAHPHWQAICADVVTANGHIEYTDPVAANCPCRFYRLSWIPKTKPGKGNQGQNSQN